MTRISVAVALGAAILLAGGCGSAQPGGFEAAGTVTYKGNPVPRGSILLSPDSSKGHSGPAVSADIVDGKFDTKLAKQRLTDGAYRVRVDGFDGNAQPDQELPLGKQIFAEYVTTVDVNQENAGALAIEVKR
ncbi:hypothetical protein C5Y97_06160 [Blastopirellula marina]|uniref:Carboxypeptidase regulatory-like domain-containing protein n=2 Tax=Blastopirellula marina TaxID=124 RepID=A0A2S8G6V4_9BACT|nr:hypothetical protein C5Y98_06160 [Blastopirellula marina]PQO43542.1 hypothetical protein C5Y93_23110 [Blastopirellula marina]PTL45553.1 hypothetical protein C5Y97_06160 [Blastopirellula marina]